MSALHFHLHAASVLAPGMTSLAQLRSVCRGNQIPVSAEVLQLPSPEMLPANERRRASQVVRLTQACIQQVLENCPFPVESLRSVFATDEGTGEVYQQILQAVTTTRQVSPVMFSNSVQNAPSGYFSISWRNRQSSTVVSLGVESFASGLLCAVTEAMACEQPVLLVAYDPPMAAPMDELISIQEATASAWIISSGAACDNTPVLGSFALELEHAGSHAPTVWPTWLPTKWATNSSASALAALGLLEAPIETTYRMTFGTQLLCLQRLA
ncbi:MAG: beta-ketoacyl synthase chain length factor [Pseudomonadota bacterium]